MFIKRGRGEILDVIAEENETADDEKVRKALKAAKNLVEDGNKTDSKSEAEKN